MQEAANQALPYPFQENEIIGGDCVESIQRRLLANNPSPSAHAIQLARIQAEDLFEVKVEIVRVMSGLHPEGDWLGRGARALDNPRSSTGEQSLERLNIVLSDLKSGGVNSDSFQEFKDRVLLRITDETAHSTA